MRKRMTRVLSAANKGYPDGYVRAYFRNPKGDHGDTLALFVVKELQGVQTKSEAIQMMQSAIRELNNVIDSLSELKD